MKNTKEEKATETVLIYVLETEKENYINYCEENSLDPKNLKKSLQTTHVHALALIAMGLSFEL